MFSEKLRKAMSDLGINQVQLVGLTGKSKGSISQYLSGKQVPSAKGQADIATALGLTPDYFEQEDKVTAILKKSDTISRIKTADAAKLLGIDKKTLRLGLQQGVFPWGYGIHTSENQWTYFINANRFAEIEGVSVPLEMVV